mmetsp:Transcript_14965/g.30243  ORF Transcript_14965/g.30243 Transcript_14965/m.30243 type:complete len:205 (-) Transcript_14965:328-942(-)
MLLDCLDQLVQSVRAAPPQVHHQPGVAPRLVNRSNDAIDYIRDESELSHCGSVSIFVDLPALVHRQNEFETRHVGPSSRSVHGKESELGDVHFVEVVVSVPEKFGGSLGRCVRRNRLIADLVLRERGCGGSAVHRGGGGNHKPGDTKFSAHVVQTNSGHDVRVNVRERVLDRKPDPCLRRQVTQDVGLVVLKELSDCLMITEIH